MFRINLIKIIFLLFLITPIQVWGAVEKDGKIILDQKGNPIPFALVKVDDLPAKPVNEKGEIQSLPSGERVLIFAIGYQTQEMNWEEWLQAQWIILKEKSTNLSEVVVSATRTERSVEDLPMPVTVLNTEQIQETGGVRLSEILREQTGLQISSDHGAGLQMQGLDSDYILILLDGEPLIGRTAGTFDLDRISVSNIDRIEILRGPSSAIYGSEAMAGVVNIITKTSSENSKIDFSLRQRSFNTWNPALEIGLANKKWNTDLFIDHFKTDGFDLTPETVGQTQNPYQASTAQLKITGEISPKLSLSLFGRGYLENSDGLLQSGVSSDPQLLSLENKREDFNLNPTLRFKPNENWLFTLRGMSSWFSTLSDSRFVNSGESFDFQDFRQFYHRTELQTDYQITSNQLLTLGMGQLTETVEATRYEDNNRFDAGYFFLQHQWDLGQKINLVSGLRADFHSQYGQRLSPKISGQYRLSEKLSWQGSIGAGFKAPDFRQLLLNFNNAASGYYVFGATLAQEGISRLEEQGLVAQILLNPQNLGELKAETSWAINTGFRWKVNENASLQVNAFRNSIDNLIETAPIAQLVTGQNAFSYFNVSSVITQGLEVDAQMKLSEKLRVSAGYALLDTRDQEVVERIENGEVFKRNSQNQTRRVTRADYGGLFNRSRHSGNLKLNYHEQFTGTDWSLRAIYRGKFGFADRNGNLILDDESEYAAGWVSLNLSLSKTLDNGIFLEGGGTNLLNTATPAQPNNPGRVLFLGIKIPVLNLMN